MKKIPFNYGLLLGPILFLAVFLGTSDAALELPARLTLATVFLMGAWWITSAIHLGAVALIPLALFPIMGVEPMANVAENYANPTIFLFMGGFMMAQGMQKWGLHKRLALHIISFIGKSPGRILAGFMLATAFLSMWVSNTATTVMMIPMGLALIEEVKGVKGGVNFSKALMLGIAYSASVGGVGTLIGSPPNLILAGQLKELFPEMAEIDFVSWMAFGVPTAAGFLILIWSYLFFIFLRKFEGGKQAFEAVEEELESLGKFKFAEGVILLIFSLTAFAWLTRADLEIGTWSFTGWQTRLSLPFVHDGTVAMFFALVMFSFPIKVKRGWEFVLDWEWAKRIPWEVILLFGGGFALAGAFLTTGLSDWFGRHLGALGGLPTPLMIFSVALFTTFLTEVTSNTAITTLLMPVLAAAAQVIGINPLQLMFPATIAASFAFMLPVATPPNAIVFGSGVLKIADMARAGFLLNIIGAAYLTLMILILGR